MKRDVQHYLMVAAGLVIIALTGVAFWLSYAHLAEIAMAHGLGDSPSRGWAWPATLDAFIVAGELLMLRAALRGKVDPWAIGLTVVGSGGSIALNVWGVGGSAEPIDYVVAAIPPTAALLAFGALMRQIHEYLTDAGHTPTDTNTDTAFVGKPTPTAQPTRPRPVPQVVPTGARMLPIVAPQVTTTATTAPTEATTGAPAEVTVERAEDTPETPDRAVAELEFPPLVEAPSDWPLVTSAVPASVPRQVVTEVVTLTPAELRRKAKALHRQVVTSGGRGVTIAQLRNELGLSRRQAAELRRQVVTEEADR